MSYSGVQPTFGTFPSDLFTGNGSNTVFTMSSVPGNDAALLVTIDGVRQHTDTYSYSANTLTFSEAPPSGAIIETVNMGSRADVIVTDGVYRKTQFTATAAQTNFNILTGYTVGFVDVYLNGIRLVVGDDFTANDGSTIILAVAAAAGDAVEVIAYGTFNVANALQKSGDTMSGNLVVSGTTLMNAPVAIANNTGNTVVIANTGAVTISSNTVTIGTSVYCAANGNIGVNNAAPTSIITVSSTNTRVWSSNDALYSYTPVAHELAITNHAVNTTGSFAGILLRGGQTSVDSEINAARIGAIREGSTYATSLAFATRRGSDGNMIEGMRINTNGYVTMPQQPAFSVYKSASASNQNAVIVYDSVRFNTGNNYSTSTGRFTAPVAGKYQFNVVNNMGIAAGADTILRVNGSNVVGVEHDPATGGSAYWLGLSLPILLQLSAGDYVEVYVNGAPTYGVEGTPWNAFSGYLVG
jgi:hypothetical protein